MTTLAHLRICGYRRLTDVELAMKPFSVLIGANGSGKTSFLEVLSLLAASCNAKLSARISDLGGIGDILTRDGATAIDLDLSAPVEGREPLDYELRLEPRGQGYWIRREMLTSTPERGEPERLRLIDAENGTVRYFDSCGSRPCSAAATSLRSSCSTSPR